MKTGSTGNLANAVKIGLSDPNGRSFSQALHTLLVLPEIARDPKVYDLLIMHALNHQGAIAYRYTAARILNSIGDPLGILHLTYNSLSVHPILKHGYRKNSSGWTDAWLLRVADQLTEECVDLLIQDMSGSDPVFHGDVLAALPEEMIVTRMQNIPPQHDRGLLYSSYVLAMKGRDHGRKLLEKAATEMTCPLLAILALSHIPDAAAIDILRNYSSPNHPYYSDDRRLHMVLPLAKQRLQLLTSPNEFPCLEVMNNDYRRLRDSITVRERRTSHGLEDGLVNKTFSLTEPLMFFENVFENPSCTDFLAEFGSISVRTQCADMQRENINKLVRMDGVPLGKLTSHNCKFFGLGTLDYPTRERELPHPLYYLDGFNVVYETSDYEWAATDWLINPERYRHGYGFALRVLDPFH